MPERLPLVKLPLSQAAVKRSYQDALMRVLNSGNLILSAEVGGFEREFAKFCGAGECVGVANGTDALQIALRLSGIEPRSRQEVITTPLTASFTAHAIVAAGAKPVFVDVNPDTLLIDAGKVDDAVNSHTAALLPVHLYGQVCDLDALSKLAKRRRISLVQDAAQAHGSLYREQPLASLTDISCYSFYPTKNLGALGDGGALVTNNMEISRRARLFHDGGRSGSHVAQVEAVNSRLDELQAAFLRIHLKQLPKWNLRRALLAACYDELLAEAGIDEIRPIARAKHSQSYYHLYVVRVRPGNKTKSAGTKAKQRPAQRKLLMDFLSHKGIDSGIHYEYPLHLHPAFRRFGYAPGDFPHAEQACDEILSLPMHPFLSRSEVARVVRALKEYYRR